MIDNLTRKSNFVVQSNRIECTTCNKWFISESKKQEHLLQHKPCPYPNCSFNAIEKVLNQHITSVHLQPQSSSSSSSLHYEEKRIKKNGQEEKGSGSGSGSGSGKEKEMVMPSSLLELIPEKYRYAASIGNNPEDIKK